MIRVNDKQKLDNFSVAQTESGENLFQTDTTIAPENIEVNTGKGWEKLKKTQEIIDNVKNDPIRKVKEELRQINSELSNMYGVDGK